MEMEKREIVCFFSGSLVVVLRACYVCVCVCECGCVFSEFLRNVRW